jgi:hypothetical protein
MPVISMFFGIVIRMYYREHEPAHFHAEYAGRWAVFDLTGSVRRGDLGSRRAQRLVRLWAIRNHAGLLENWRRAATGKAVLPIPPLE